MRHHRLASWLCTGLLLASTTLAFGQDRAYRVGPNDILQVTVYGQPALTGPFKIDIGGDIGYPVVGTIKVGGKSAAEISTIIAKELAEHIPGLTVTATVAQYAPVYVVGDVRVPGKYEFQPGMTVMELLAIGGGTGRTENEAAAAGVQLLAVQQEYTDLQLQIAALGVKRARLTAELNGSDFSFQFAEGPTTSDEERKLHAKMIDGEKNLFETRLNTMKAEQQSLSAQISNYDEEIKSLQEGIKLRETEIQLQQENVDSNRSLVEKGLAARSNLRDMERILSEIRREGLEAQSYLARARQNQLATQQRITNLAETRRATAATELQDLELNLVRMERRGNTQLQTMAEIAKRAGSMTSSAAARRTNVVISRNQQGKFEEIAGTMQSEVQPGDIIRVELDMSRMIPAGSPADEPASSKGG